MAFIGYPLAVRLLEQHLQEQEMQKLRDVHEREMTKLRYELEQVRTEGQSAHGLLLNKLFALTTGLYPRNVSLWHMELFLLPPPTNLPRPL